LVSVDKQGAKASVLLQRVLVLATGLDTTAERKDDRGITRARVLTVSVSLAEAQLLALAQTTGNLVAVIRNTGDPRVTDSPVDLTRSMLESAKERTIAKASAKRPVKLQQGAN